MHNNELPKGYIKAICFFYSISLFSLIDVLITHFFIPITTITLILSGMIFTLLVGLSIAAYLRERRSAPEPKEKFEIHPTLLMGVTLVAVIFVAWQVMK